MFLKQNNIINNYTKILIKERDQFVHKSGVEYTLH